MHERAAHAGDDWEQRLTGRLQVFVDIWKGYQGTEQAGAQEFLKGLLDIYNNRREAYAKNWWRFVEPRPGLREAMAGRGHVLVLPRVSPNLIVCRQSSAICFDGQLMVVALSGYYELGILPSCLHETWAWARGSTLKGDLRYTNTTIFETFPFPLHPRGKYDPRKPPDTEKAKQVALAAEAFDRRRAAICKDQRVGLTKVHNLLKAGQLPELSRTNEAVTDLDRLSGSR